MILSPSSNKQASDRMGGQQDNASNPQQQSYADTDTPPTYEVAVEDRNGICRVQQPPFDQKIRSPAPDPVAAYQHQHNQPNQPPVINAHTAAGPSGPSMPQTRVYHYVNQTDGNQITSFLPPDHPEMVCLQRGSHDEETKFGLLGILAAIFWFPLGIGLCMLDRTVTCKRCGATIRGRPGIQLGGGSSKRSRR